MRKRVFAGVLLLLLAFGCLPVPAHGATTELVMQYLIDEQPVEEVRFSVYHIATVDENDFKKFYLDEAYVPYQLDFSIVDDLERVIDLAKLLESYILRDHLEPVESFTTDETGIIRFSGLTYGIYLLSGESINTEKGRCTPVPALFVLPCYTDGELNNSLTAYIKHELSPDTVACRVLVTWQEEEPYTESIRPSYVTIQLLRNGVVADEVQVNASMGWTYTWEGLDSSARWSVVQTGLPSIYQTSLSQVGITCMFTNHAGSAQEPTEPSSPDQSGQDTTGGESGSKGHYVRPQTLPSKQETELPTVRPGVWTGGSVFDGVAIESPNLPMTGTDHQSDGSNGENPGSVNNGDTVNDGTGSSNEGISDGQIPAGSMDGDQTKLPQTGQLWWPVPFFLLLGAVLQVIGLCVKRKS